MKKLFISQPMRGKTDEEILRERNEAITIAKDIMKDDIEVIDSFFKTLLLKLSLYGFSVSRLNFFHLLMWFTSAKAGMMQEVAELSTNVLKNMALI